MDLRFNLSLAEGYKNKSQIARVLTEHWLADNMYCPICGETSIRQAEANAPVKDFVCDKCKAQYELKSKNTVSGNFSATVADGVYYTMIKRITSLENPNFFFLHYNNYQVNNLVIVPKCFFIPNIIEKRKPLNKSARRSGWEGCNIILNEIPNSAKIPIIINGEERNRKDVVKEYNKVYSLQSTSVEGRGWIFDTISCIEKLDRDFSLQQMYAFAESLKMKHPDNNYVHAKIRQQLQILRDKGFIEFISRGKYRRIL